MQPYEQYVVDFNKIVEKLFKIVPTQTDVDDLIGEEDKLEFIKVFRQLIRVKNILDSFSDFKWSDLNISEQKFENYKSKYLDWYTQVKNRKDSQKVSILNDVDFVPELLIINEINVTYILKLFAKYKDIEDEEVRLKQRENISNILNSNLQLRSKKELIEKFIDENLIQINSEDVEDEFYKFLDEAKEKEFDKLCKEENLDNEQLKKVVDTYIYEQRTPFANDIAKTLKEKPKFLERKKIVTRILDKIVNFVDKFYEK